MEDSYEVKQMNPLTMFLMQNQPVSNIPQRGYQQGIISGFFHRARLERAKAEAGLISEIETSRANAIEQRIKGMNALINMHLQFETNQAELETKKRKFVAEAQKAEADAQAAFIKNIGGQMENQKLKLQLDAMIRETQEFLNGTVPPNNR